jgi:hypothetical protein
VPACNRLCGAIQRVFRSREPTLLWSAFQTYVKLKIMYAAPVWSPSLKYDVNAVERVQRRFTKKLAGMGNLSYPERLNVLHALSLEKERLVADVVLLHRCIHGQSDYKLSDIGVALSTNNERSGKVRLDNNNNNMTFITPLLPSSKGQSRLHIFIIIIVRKSVQMQFKTSFKDSQ